MQSREFAPQDVEAERLSENLRHMIQTANSVSVRQSTTKASASMSVKRPGALAEWLLIIAMTLCARSLLISICLSSILLALIWEAWPFLLIGAAVILAAVVEALRRPARGYPIEEADEPELMALVHGASAALGFDKRLAVRVIPVPDASLSLERIGLARSFVLNLSWQMITAMDVDELSAVVAHELAHEDNLATVRGRALVGARNRLADSLPVPGVSQALLAASREHAIGTETTADSAAAAIFGAEVVIDALLRTVAIESLFDTLVDHWCDVMADVGEYPSDVYDCASRALEDPEVMEWLIEGNNQAPQLEDPSDSHPSVQARIEALGGMPAIRRTRGEPVRIRHGEKIVAWCHDEIFEPKKSELRPGSIASSPPGRFDWDPNGALADLRDAVDETDTRTALTKVAGIIDAGTWREFAAKLDPDLLEAPTELRAHAEEAVVVNCVGTALIGTLIGAGWRRANPWLNQILESPEGERVDVFQRVDDAIGSQDTSGMRVLVDAAALGEPA